MSFGKVNRGVPSERLDRIKASASAASPVIVKPKTAVDDRMAQRAEDDAAVDAQDAHLMKMAMIACGALFLVALLFTLPALFK